MKVLVTGSSGFIGSAVSLELISRGDEVLAFDRPNHDVRDANDLSVSVRETEADAIINLAGMLGTPELFGYEYKAAEINILGAINVYDVAKKYDIPVVQIGTGHKGQPNPYAITKGCAEDIGLARAQWCGEKITVVRAYHAYGPGQPVGPPHGDAHVHKFFPTFACRALTSMPLEVCGGGAQLIDPVYVGDCARVLVDAIGGTYDYGNVVEAGNGRSFAAWEIADDIGYAATRVIDGLTYDVGSVPSRDGEPRNARVVAENPACKNPWPYMVAETVEWYWQWLYAHSVRL